MICVLRSDANSFYAVFSQHAIVKSVVQIDAQLP